MEQSQCPVPPTAAKLQFSYCHQHFKQMIIAQRRGSPDKITEWVFTTGKLRHANYTHYIIRHNYIPILQYFTAIEAIMRKVNCAISRQANMALL